MEPDVNQQFLDELKGVRQLIRRSPTKAEAYSKAYALYPFESLATALFAVRQRLRLQSISSAVTPAATL